MGVEHGGLRGVDWVCGCGAGAEAKGKRWVEPLPAPRGRGAGEDNKGSFLGARRGTPGEPKDGGGVR